MTTVEVRLSADTIEESPILPLESLAAVEKLLSTATPVDVMYGNPFVDAVDPLPMFRRQPSLRVGSGVPRTGHSFDWFTELLIDPHGESWRAMLDGTVWFEGDFRVQRANGSPIPVEQFAADGVRWWTAFDNRDPRVNVAGQDAAHEGAPRWRPPDGSGPLRHDGPAARGR